MGLIDNIKECFSCEEFPKSPTFRAVLFGEEAGYFENVKSIVCYSCETIILALAKGCLQITGQNLYIKKYCLGDVVICGKIKGISRI